MSENLSPRGSSPRDVATPLELAERAVKAPAVVDLGAEARALAERDARDRPLVVSAHLARTGNESGDESAELTLARAEEPAEQPFRDDPVFGSKDSAAERGDSDGAGTELTEEERKKLEELKTRDREVRAHEQAHKSTGGQYAGQIRYEYERGPDGRMYVTGGEVPIDVAPIPGDPAATVQKMEQVRRAALAPADPSGPDYHVASRAAQEAQRARLELAHDRYEAATEGADEFPPDAPEASSGTPIAARVRLAVDVTA